MSKITAAQMINGLVKWRQGGTSGDASWATGGTINTDVSGKNAFIQVGSKTLTGLTTTITFPVAFSQIPVVVCTHYGSAGVFYGTYIVGVTTSSFDYIDQSYTASSPLQWIAIGQ